MCSLRLIHFVWCLVTLTMSLWRQEKSEEHKGKCNPNKLKLYSPLHTSNGAWVEHAIEMTSHWWLDHAFPAHSFQATCRNSWSGGLVGDVPTHLWGGYRALPQSNSPSLLCLDEGPGMGLHCQGVTAVQETSNLLPGCRRPGFCSTQGAEHLLPATPVECHILGMEPSIW